MGEAQKKIEEFGLTTCNNINKVVSAVWRNAAVSGYSILTLCCCYTFWLCWWIYSELRRQSFCRICKSIRLSFF